jgi:hypothetical protein
MGTRADAPWDNDSAADWFSDVFEETQLAQRVAETLRLDIVDHHREIRAAASLLIFLGRVRVWPLKHLDEQLELAASKLEQMAAMPEADRSMPVDAVRAEAALLRSQTNAGSERGADELDSIWRALRGRGP